MHRRRIPTDYLRSALFGLEDGLVSTTGTVIGMSTATQDAKLVILAGMVVVAVEAISMAAGQFISEEAVHELEHKSGPDNIIVSALLMFGSYALAGLIPILPFVLLPLATANIVAVAFAITSLFLLGYLKAKITQVNALKSGLQILFVGGIATIIGVLVGILIKT